MQLDIIQRFKHYPRKNEQVDIPRLQDYECGLSFEHQSRHICQLSYCTYNNLSIYILSRFKSLILIKCLRIINSIHLLP